MGAERHLFDQNQGSSVKFQQVEGLDGHGGHGDQIGRVGMVDQTYLKKIGCVVVMALGNLAWSLRLLRRAGVKCDNDVMVVQFPSKIR